MNHRTTFKATCVAVTMLFASAIQAAPITKEEYKRAKEHAESTYKTEKAACDAMSGNAKDICVEEAKGHQEVAKAEAEYAYSGKASDHQKVSKAKADAEYNVAKERCDDKSGNDKDVCVKEAKAVHTKALVDSKAHKKENDARKDAASDKRDADYKVAIEKCDSLAGDAKSSCVNSAKTQFGK